MCTSVASCSAVALAACMALSASSAYSSRQWNRHPLGARQRADRQRERARIIGCGVFSCQANAAHQQERELQSDKARRQGAGRRSSGHRVQPGRQLLLGGHLHSRRRHLVVSIQDMCAFNVTWRQEGCGKAKVVVLCSVCRG